ncbi:MAG: c-type cytochrome [Acidimicrobiia bacterium]
MSLRTIIFLVNALALAAFVVFAFLAARRKTPPPPLNLDEYYDDETMEGPKLERYLGAAVLFSAVLAASLPLYWLLEPDRQERMSEDFDADAAQRGKEMFALTGAVEPAGRHARVLPLECARCHGDNGQGGVATQILQPDEPGELPRTVQWAAPSLDDVLLRFSPEEVAEIITYGRPGTPMPAWGIDGGGALPEQGITDLVAYLQSIQLTPEEAKKRSAERASEILEANPGLTEGEALFMANCARCHTKGYSYGEPGPPGGGGAYGPNLRGGVTLRQFPALSEGLQDHIDFVTEGSEFQTQYGSQGVGTGKMPGFADLLTPEQIDKIVLYERGL